MIGKNKYLLQHLRTTGFTVIEVLVASTLIIMVMLAVSLIVVIFLKQERAVRASLALQEEFQQIEQSILPIVRDSVSASVSDDGRGLIVANADDRQTVFLIVATDAENSQWNIWSCHTSSVTETPCPTSYNDDSSRFVQINSENVFLNVAQCTMQTPLHADTITIPHPLIECMMQISFVDGRAHGPLIPMSITPRWYVSS